MIQLVSITPTQNGFHIKYEYQSKEGLTTAEATFNKLNDCTREYNSAARKVLLLHLERYIKNKRILADTEALKVWYYDNVRVDSIARAQKMLTWALAFDPSFSSCEIYRNVSTFGEKILRDILPPENSKSYNGAVEKLEEILTFCKSQLQ